MYIQHLTALICLLLSGVSLGKPIIFLQPSGPKMCEKLKRTVIYRYPITFNMNDMACQIDDATKSRPLMPSNSQHTKTSENSTNAKMPLILIDTRGKGKQRVPYGKITKESNQRPHSSTATNTNSATSKIDSISNIIQNIYTITSDCSNNTSVGIAYQHRANYWGAINHEPNGIGALGATCTKDTECKDKTTVGCYVGRCQCKPLMNFSPTNKSCVSCNKYGDTYSIYDGIGIDGHNCQRIDSVASADMCWQHCLGVNGSFCKSAEYKDGEAENEKAVCLLGNVVYHEVIEDTRSSDSNSEGWMFLQRDCQ